jgi:hypothetical protein
MERIPRPEPHEVPDFHRGYLEQATGNDLVEALRNASDRTWEVVYRIPTGHADHSYAPGKWTIKEVFQHVLDWERIFCCRALCFARGEQQALPGFDEDAYAANAFAGERDLHHLLRDHDRLRVSTIDLFRSFRPDALERTGIASGQRISVRAIGWIIAGHAMHHMHIIEQRYLDHG